MRSLLVPCSVLIVALTGCAAGGAQPDAAVVAAQEALLARVTAEFEAQPGFQGGLANSGADAPDASASFAALGFSPDPGAVAVHAACEDTAAGRSVASMRVNGGSPVEVRCGSAGGSALIVDDVDGALGEVAVEVRGLPDSAVWAIAVVRAED